jgi:DNA repair protein RadC
MIMATPYSITSFTNSGSARNIENAVIEQAMEILADRIREPDTWISSPTDTRRYVTLELAEERSEKFCVLWLDNRHGVIGFERLFNGTIDGASVHPREVVVAGLKKNAAAAILVHNHPSGNPSPSNADKAITSRLKDALALVDIRVLDHLIVAGTNTASFAEQGLI